MFQWLAGEPPIRIIDIDQVWNEVKKIIENATDELVLVSPYNDYSVPLTEAVAKAAETVRIVAVCREEQKAQESKHFQWLSSVGADVHLVSRLHAKIYYNESKAIITSMNLLKSSATDSKEIGFIISDTGMRDQIREYVQRDLIAHSQHLAPASKVAKPKPPAARPPQAEPTKTPDPGFCIRCTEEIPYNPEYPLCRKDFRTWNKYQDPNYPERYCHLCGHERANISFTKPLCRSCHRKVTAAT